MTTLVAQAFRFIYSLLFDIKLAFAILIMLI